MTDEKKVTPGKPIPAPTRRSFLMRGTGGKTTIIREVTNDVGVIRGGGLCRVLSRDKSLYLQSEPGHTEHRPRNANCFVRRARRGK